MTFSVYCEQRNKKLSEQYQLHLYFSVVMPRRLISCWLFLIVLKNFFLFILIFLATSVLFINLTAFINSCASFRMIPAIVIVNHLKILYSFTSVSWGLNGTCKLGPFQFLEGLLHFPSREEEWRSFLHASTGKAYKAKLEVLFPVCHIDGTERGCWSTGEALLRKVPAGRDGLTMSFGWLLPEAASFLSGSLLGFLSLSIKWRKNIPKMTKGKGPDMQSGALFYIPLL